MAVRRREKRIAYRDLNWDWSFVQMHFAFFFPNGFLSSNPPRLLPNPVSRYPFSPSEGETIRINVKNRISGGTGMLSAAGLSSGLFGTGKSKTLGLAPPPSGGRKIRSPLPPPPNDPAAARINSPCRDTDLKGSKENVKQSNDLKGSFEAPSECLV